jgi:hypothetical protein
MMRRCSAFVGVVNRRRDVPHFFCSRFVLVEFGLAIQARRPRLLLIDQRVNASPFERLAPDERHVFAPSRPEAGMKEMIRKIKKSSASLDIFQTGWKSRAVRSQWWFRASDPAVRTRRRISCVASKRPPTRRASGSTYSRFHTSTTLTLRWNWSSKKR